ncbi:MAG: BatD family protein, partial [Chromatiaceae bacterium]|nr:BatD family protein [Chromatiaceae bacterium]
MPGESKTRHRRLDLVTLVYLLSLLVPTMSAAGVSASLDRSAISLNETVQLVLESDGDPDTRPDLSVLAEDFEILDRRSSHRVSVINGQRSERHLLMLRIRPRHIGELGIPAIPFGDGITEPLQLSVAPAETGSGEPVAMSPAPAGGGESVSAPNAFVEADLEPNEGYVGQELILTVEVFMDGPIQGARLHDPQVPNTRVLPLGEDHKQVVREGKSYRVYQRRYALFPQHPGRLEIGPQRFEGWVPGAGAMSGTADYASSGKQIAEDSERLIGKVLPAPDTAGRAEWLPARELSLTESGPETYRAQTGQPIERRISLRADGVMARDLPVLAVPAPHQLTEQQRQPGLWDERRPQGVIGNRLQVVVLTAREPGHYRLPPISLEWWSTKTERWETAKLPARDLVVSAAHAGDPWLSPPQPANADQYAQQPPLSSRADMPHEPTVTESQVH